MILALGTELGETDYDVVFDGGFLLTGQLIRVDLDPEELAGTYPVSLGLVSDASSAATALAPLLEARPRNGRETVAALFDEMNLCARHDLAPFVSFFDAIEHTLPDAILVGDSTAPVYAGNVLARAEYTRRWFNSSTGYGTLGYALPAAIGARRARPDLPVVALVGDGGVMFTLAELATAVDEQLPIILIVWHNQGYEEIRRAMDDADVVRCGVDIQAPDFKMVASGFGVEYVHVSSPNDLIQALGNLTQVGQATTIVEVDAAAWTDSVA